jgi:small-conductance mechanosensitive channel
VAFLEYTLYANTVRAWLLALLIATAALLTLRLIRKLLHRQLVRLSKRTNTDVDDVLGAAVGSTRAWFLVIVALWAGSISLVISDRMQDILANITVIAVLVQIGVWSTAAIRTYVEVQTGRKAEVDAASVTTLKAIGFLISAGLWVVLFLVALDNQGIDVTALVAGLGVGGIAIALALQNILSDLFASLSIVLDKPFVYGDFIVVDTLSGTVEHVGLKTTRVRSLSGEQLVFSNNDLLKSRVRNFKRMSERRVAFTIGVIYQTPRSTLEEIPNLLRQAVEAQPDTRMDRAHFKGFGPSSLDFEVVYYVLTPDYAMYMDRQQAINLEIVRKFEEADVEFAYPTQTLFVTEQAEPA